MWISAAALLIVFWLLARSALWFLPVAVWPVLIGGLVWRYDGLPWTDIASWTLPAALLVAVIMVTIPLTISALVGIVPVAAWLYGFMFWTRVARWWYERVLETVSLPASAPLRPAQGLGYPRRTDPSC